MKLPFTLLLASMAVCQAANPAITLSARGTGLFLLTDNNQLVKVCDNQLASPSPPMPITGLGANDSLVAIDVRPQNQQLYGLARNTSSGAFQLYCIAPANGAATPVGTPALLQATGGGPLITAATRFGMDFNPQVDRLRVVTSTGPGMSSGINFRINPNNGEVLDGLGMPGGNHPDSTISGLSNTIDEAAYTNNIAESTRTTLYTLDSASDSLFIQNPANGGNQTSQVFVTLSGIPVNFSAALGFDIPPGVDAATSNGPASGSGYALLTIAGTTKLYRVNLSSGAATEMGTPPIFNLRSLAVRTQIPTAVALGTGTNVLTKFRLDTPATITNATVNGLNGGEVLVGIDYRPSTGELMGLAINAAANTGTFYRIDPASGAATAIGTPGSIAITVGVNPADLPDPAVVDYDIDINPMVDRVRVICGNGLNFRINPATGQAVDGDANASNGITPDTSIAAGNTIAAAAYTNSYGSPNGGIPATTTLFTLDPISNSLLIQSNPNGGIQTSVSTVRVNGTPLDFSTMAGFDITAEGGANSISNAASNGHGWAALNVAGVARLYRIDLSNGSATAMGQIGTGTGLSALVVGAEPGLGFATLGWSSLTNGSYKFETSADLSKWKPYPGTVIAPGAFTSISVPLYQGEGRRFWRVVLP